MIEVPYGKAVGAPAVPVLFLAFRLDERVGGPALLDTGYDGGVQANGRLRSFLEGRKPAGKETFWAAGEPMECRVHEVVADLYAPGSRITKPLGTIRVYAPIDDDQLDEHVLVGREILNRLTLQLDGKRVRAT